MRPCLKLAVFGLRQVLGGGGDETLAAAGTFVEHYCTDHSQTLPRALATANDRAWKTLSIALAGDRWFDQLKNWFAPGDEKAFAEQVRLFLTTCSFRVDGSSAHFRKKCLAELNAARQAELLSAGNLSPRDIAKQAEGFQRFTDRQGMIEGAEQVVSGIADDLAHYRNLAELLRQRTPGGPPLLVAAFAYFFRREVETDKQLAHGLFWDSLRQMSIAQEQAFEEVGRALTTLGGRFDDLFNELARIEEVVVETQAVAVSTHGAVLDLQAELQRFGSMHDAKSEEIQRLMQEVLNRLSHNGMQKGELKPHHSLSIRSEDERNAVKQLLAQFRQLTPEQQRDLPALQNGLGKLQIGSGDPGGARQTFLTVAQNTTEARAQAEAHFNAYRAALEEKKWAEALEAIQLAATLDSQRFAPFELQRYQAIRILGAGGFGTAFLCHDCHFNGVVVIKSLHDVTLERNLNEVFREAQVLGQLHHSGIIGVRDCTFADPENRARPYIVMEFFPGESLENFIQERDALSLEDVIVVAKQIALGMHAAHEKGICHRDLKPDNVLVRKEGSTWKVKIIDFGLALRKQTIEASIAVRSAGNTVLSESVAGAIKYAPPEQMGELEGVKPGPYSDVFSFGKLCCYALFKTTDPKERHWKDVPENIRADLKDLLEQCREEGLDHRLHSFQPVLQRLERIETSLDRLQKEDESELRLLMWELLDRSPEKLPPDRDSAVNEICATHRILRERAAQLFDDVRKQWERQQGPLFQKRGVSWPRLLSWVLYCILVGFAGGILSSALLYATGKSMSHPVAVAIVLSLGTATSGGIIFGLVSLVQGEMILSEFLPFETGGRGKKRTWISHLSRRIGDVTTGVVLGTGLGMLIGILGSMIMTALNTVAGRTVVRSLFGPGQEPMVVLFGVLVVEGVVGGIALGAILALAGKWFGQE